MTEQDFLRKILLPKKWGKWAKYKQKIGFFKFIRKFSNFFGIWSIMNVCTICCILARIPYLEKNLVPKLRAKMLSANHITGFLNTSLEQNDGKA